MYHKPEIDGYTPNGKKLQVLANSQHTTKHLKCTGFWRWYVPWSVQGSDGGTYHEVYRVLTICFENCTMYVVHASLNSRSTHVTHNPLLTTRQ